MPEIWQCAECGLVFTTWDTEPAKPWSGFSVTRILVCNECGTQHELHVAREEQGEPYTIFYEARILCVPAHGRVRVMAEIRELVGCSLAHAKTALAALPFGVGGPAAKEEAGRVAARFSALGAEVVVEECARDLNFAYCDVLPQDKLEVAAGPLFEIPGGEAGFPPMVCEVPGVRSGVQGHVDLPRQPCGHCGAVGTLVTYAGTTPQRCPHCGGSRFDVLGVWMN